MHWVIKNILLDLSQKGLGCFHGVFLICFNNIWTENIVWRERAKYTIKNVQSVCLDFSEYFCFFGPYLLEFTDKSGHSEVRFFSEETNFLKNSI